MMVVLPLNEINLRQLLLRYGFPLILGSLLPLAFAPYNLWPIALVIPALLFWRIDKEVYLPQVFLAGWAFGLGYFGFGVYWVYNSLHDFGMAPPLVAGAITALLIATLASFPALTLVVYRYLARRRGNRAIWFLPLLWFSFEWLRGWILTGLPWLSLGYSQIDSPLSGYAPIVGVYGIGALMIVLAIALLLLVRERKYLHLITLLVIPAFGLMLKPIEWTQAQPTSLKVTMVQGNIPQEIKWRYEQRQNIFDVYWRETSQHWDSDLIVWPETALPGHSSEIEKSVLQPMESILADRSSKILTGIVSSDTDRQEFYNSLMLMGGERQLYHKRHLVIFGEYYPMRWLLDFLRSWINIPYSDLTPGPDVQPLMSVNDTVLGLSICFEDVFSRDVMTALPEANLLINVSNDAWFGDSTAPHQHLQIAQMRSAETARPMVRSTNTGVSAFIDYRGRIVQVSEQFKVQSLTQVITGRSGLTPFFYFAKVQGWIALLLLILGVGLGRGKAANSLS